MIEAPAKQGGVKNNLPFFTPPFSWREPGPISTASVISLMNEFSLCGLHVAEYCARHSWSLQRRRDRAMKKLKLRRRVAGAAIAFGIVLGSTVVAVPAQAAPAPSCVQMYTPGNRVQVTNTCKYTVRVKVVWAFATDGACTTIPAFKTKFFNKKGWPARLDGLQKC